MQNATTTSHLNNLLMESTAPDQLAAADVSPQTIQLHVKLSPDDEIWLHALSIPPEDLPRLTHRPFKWLRYVAYTILGCDGSLTASDGRPLDPNSPLPEDPKSLSGSYYFTPNGPTALVDAQAINHTETSQSDRSTNFQNYRKDVVARDGKCVVTGRRDVGCNPAHLIPLKKGNKYIEAVTRHRSRDAEVIDDINDPRNGVLLRCDLHGSLARGDLALIYVPNNILDASDIPFSPSVAVTTPPTDTLSMIPQWIREDPDLPTVNSARLVGEDRPADVIVELHYGAACCLAWGQKAFLEALQTRAHETLPSNDDLPKPDRHARRERAPANRPPGSMDMWDMIAALWSINHRLVPAPARTEDSRPKVEDWLRGVSEAEGGDPGDV